MANVPPENPLRVLIVEDLVDSAKSMAVVLQMYGHHVQIALDGPAAIELACKNEPDVVLLDIGLPGMDGWTLVQRLTEFQFKKRPFFIAISGYGEEAAKKQSAEAGIDLHLVKPVELDSLKNILSRFRAIIR